MRSPRVSGGVSHGMLRLEPPLLANCDRLSLWSSTVSGSESDLVLVARVKTDPAAFGQLYERYVVKIYNYVYYRTGNHHDAEEFALLVESILRNDYLNGENIRLDGALRFPPK